MKKNTVYSSTGNVWKSALLSFPMLLVMFVFLAGGYFNFSDGTYAVAFFTTFAFFGTLFYLMLYTGRTDRYRAIGFVVSALLFALSFIVNLINVRGEMTYDANDMMTCQIPFCHIVTTMVIIPAAVKQTIIFPGSMVEGFASISSMLVLVIGFSIVLGRGFCSWGCFYGGWDDGASRVRRSPLIRIANTSYKWFSYAMLLIMALWAAASMLPVYCDWFCPFKAVTEFEAITSVEVLFKTIVFASIFVGLVIVLPILTKRRTQCAAFCPMGALLSFTNKINIFKVKTDASKCVNCHKCERACPMLAIDTSHKAAMNCSKCGKCVDECPTHAIQFHVAGTSLGKRATLARTLFLYPAFGLMVIFLGGSVLKGIMLIIKLISTGSLLG